MILKNKKAGMDTSLVNIILVLIVAIIIIGVAIYFIKYFTARSDREVCRASVLGGSVAQLAPVHGSENFIVPDCKTYSIIFYNDHVEINSKAAEVYVSQSHEYIKTFNELSSEVVNSVIAEELRQCWYQFLEGKKKVLTRANINVQLYTPDIGFLCDEVRFDPGVPQTRFTGFYDYLRDTLMPKSQVTYYEYLAEEDRICESYEGRLCWEDFFKDQYAETSGWPSVADISFSPGTTYVLLFLKHGKEANVATIGWGYRENYAAYALPWSAISSLDSLLRGSTK